MEMVEASADGLVSEDVDKAKMRLRQRALLEMIHAIALDSIRGSMIHPAVNHLVQGRGTNSRKNRLPLSLRSSATRFAPWRSTPRGARRTCWRSRRASTRSGRSTGCRFSRTRCRTRGVRATTSSATSATRTRPTSADAGRWMWCWGRSDYSKLSRTVDGESTSVYLTRDTCSAYTEGVRGHPPAPRRPTTPTARRIARLTRTAASPPTSGLQELCDGRPPWSGVRRKR